MDISRLKKKDERVLPEKVRASSLQAMFKV
jgi:hypothetical protein